MTRILVADDNAASMELMLHLLKSCGYTAVFAFDAEDGMRLARSAAPELILCDVNLPGMSGHDFLRSLKQDPLLDPIPVLALAAIATAGDEERLRSLGFDGYLAKPVDPGRLRAQVESFL